MHDLQYYLQNHRKWIHMGKDSREDAIGYSSGTLFDYELLRQYNLIELTETNNSW